MTTERTIVQLMPLRIFVVKITNEADEDDEQSILKAVKSYHNRLANGSVPRNLFKKIGKQLYVDLKEFNDWILKQ